MSKTPEEIKKGLFVCSDLEGNCPYCPYTVNSEPDPNCMCITELANDALAYIQQLEEELKAYRWYEGETERKEGD